MVNPHAATGIIELPIADESPFSKWNKIMPTIEPYTNTFDLPNARLVIAQSITIITTNLATKVELSTEKMCLGSDRDKIIKTAKISIEIGLLVPQPLVESKSVIGLNHIDAQIMNKNPATNISNRLENIMLAICESVLSNFTQLELMNHATHAMVDINFQFKLFIFC